MASANNVTFRRELRDESQYRLTDRLIRHMMPSYVQAEANTLVTFLEEYYKFLHSGGNPLFAAKNIFKLRDVDDFDAYKKEYEKDYNQRSTYSANAIQKYVNKPIVGPNIANGVTISWLDSSNTAILSADVANNTFTNGSVWYIGNTTPGPDGNHSLDSGIKVHDYNPRTRTITFTTKTLQQASFDSGVIRKYASNTLIRRANTAYVAEANALNSQVFDRIRNEFLLGFPNPTQAAFKLLAKNIQSLYRSKGSKRGIETLFKGVYNREADVSLPFDNVLIASGGEFTRDSYLQTVTDPRLSNFKNTLITGKDSLATAIVKDIIEVNVQGKTITKLLLENVDGTFIDEEVISAPGVDYKPTVFAGFKTLTLTSNGSGYSVGDEVKLIGDGDGGIVSVAATENFAGAIKFTLKDGGSGYRSNSIITVTNPAGFTGASATFVIGAISNTFVLSLDTTQIGALASNSQIRLNSTRWGASPYTANSVSVFTNEPIAGPSFSGIRASCNAGSNNLHFSIPHGSSIVAGDIITLSNSSQIIDEQIKVHALPDNSNFTLSTRPSASASNTELVVRPYAANTVYTLGANSSGIATFSYANIGYPIANAVSTTDFTFGSIAEITVTNQGKNYETAPTVNIIDPLIQSFQLRANNTTGGVGFLGENATIEAAVLTDNVITELNVVDHGVGYRTSSLTLEAPTGGTSGIVSVGYGGGANGAQRYTSAKSFLSETAVKMQDNDFYQSYSYELRTDIGLNDYKRFIVGIAHPSGNKLFGRYFDSQPANTVITGTGEVEQRLSTGVQIASSRLNARPLGVSRLNKRI